MLKFIKIFIGDATSIKVIVDIGDTIHGVGWGSVLILCWVLLFLIVVLRVVIIFIFNFIRNFFPVTIWSTPYRLFGSQRCIIVTVCFVVSIGAVAITAVVLNVLYCIIDCTIVIAIGSSLPLETRTEVVGGF